MDFADAAGTGPRMLTYQRDPEILELIIPQDFEQFPPQARNLAFVVPCHARIGGVVTHPAIMEDPEYKRFKASWDEAFAGASNAGVLSLWL